MACGTMAGMALPRGHDGAVAVAIIVVEVYKVVVEVFEVIEVYRW